MYSSHSHSILSWGRSYSTGGVFHLVLSTRDSHPYFLCFDSARVAVQALKYCDDCGWCETLAYVVMPDRVHWLVRSLVKEPISLIRTVKKRVRKEASSKVTWHKDFLSMGIHDPEQMLGVARSMVMDLTRSGLVKALGDYPHWDSVYLCTGQNCNASP